MTSTLDPILQLLPEHCEPQKQKHKSGKVKEEAGATMALTLEPVQIVEDHHGTSGGEPQKKERKRMIKREEVTTAPPALDLLQITEPL